MTRFEIATPVIEAELVKPYAYGVSDCFLLAAKVATALQPECTLLDEYEGRYKTKLGAQRIMMRAGFVSLTDLVDKHFKRRPPASAVYGDIAVVTLPDGEHFAVCVGQRFVVKLPHKPTFCDLGTVKAAYQVG